MKKKWLITAVCALMLVLTACAGVPDETTQAPTETTAPMETTAPTMPPEETNILRQFILPPNYSGDGEYSNFVYESPYMRNQIKSITIVGTLENAPEEVWDASEDHNGAVLVWVEPNGELYDLYIGAEGGMRTGKSCREMFMEYAHAQRISFGDVLHTLVHKEKNLPGLYQGGADRLRRCVPYRGRLGYVWDVPRVQIAPGAGPEQLRYEPGVGYEFHVCWLQQAGRAGCEQL